MTGDGRYPPSVRLHKPAEFKRVFAGGKRVKRHPLALVYLPNKEFTARLGLAIAKKAVPLAVARNRIKRLIRDDFRHNRARLPAVDLVFHAQSGLADLSNDAFRSLLNELWTHVIDRCARSSPTPSAPTNVT